jgi:hypothetical protein
LGDAGAVAGVSLGALDDDAVSAGVEELSDEGGVLADDAPRVSVL